MGSISISHGIDKSDLKQIAAPDLLLQVACLLNKAEAALQEDSQTAYLHLDNAMELLRRLNVYRHSNTSDSGQLSCWQKRRLDEYICEHFYEPIRTCRLAALLNLSTSHFSRLFKQTFRVPARIYVSRLRIQVARRMMLDTDESLIDIALASGFCDQSHFSRTFRREIGMSPQAWRQRRPLDDQAHDQRSWPT